MSIKTVGEVLVENYFWNLQESADFLKSILLCPSLDSYNAKSLLLFWDGLSTLQYLEAFEPLAVKVSFVHVLMPKFVLDSKELQRISFCVCAELPCLLSIQTFFFLQIFEAETSLRKDNLHPS